MSSQPIQILSNETNEFVAATMLSGIAASDLFRLEDEWHPARSEVRQQLLARNIPHKDWPESLHWDWARKAPVLRLLQYQGFGVVYGGQWQGCMLTIESPVHVCRLNLDKGKPLVYVDFLEIAPWNWVIKGIAQCGRYRTVGSWLFWKAVQFSDEVGFHGRIGLHALRQSEWYYERLGLQPIERDANKQDLLYFELPRAKAREILNRGDNDERR